MAEPTTFGILYLDISLNQYVFIHTTSRIKMRVNSRVVRGFNFVLQQILAQSIIISCHIVKLHHNETKNVLALLQLTN